MVTFNNISLRYTQHFINGRWEPSVLGNSYINLNPSNETIIGYVADGSGVEISLAARAAHLCYHKIWRKISLSERKVILFRAGDLISNQADYLAEIESMESGRTLIETRAEIETAANIFRNCPDAVNLNLGALSVLENRNSIFSAVPFGVIGIINDFAGSFLSTAIKVAPALSCGNTVVLKPSEFTPCSVLLMAKLCQEAGLPDGAFNIVIGGRKADAALYSHPLIDKVILYKDEYKIFPNIRFIESNYYVEKYEAVANIVFHDADLEKASDSVIHCLILNRGNICKSKFITFVDRRVANDLIDRVLNKIDKLIIGDSRCPETVIGPLVSQDQLAKLQNAIEGCLDKGSELIAGGQSFKGETNAGFYYLPTLLLNTDSNRSLSQENVFGPYMEFNFFQNIKDLLITLRNFRSIKGVALWTGDSRTVNMLIEYANPRYIWVDKCPDNNYWHVLEIINGEVLKQSRMFI
ncbi:MAG: aldehyde dehydrogenase family protein [Bacillota bacterium]